MDVMHAVHVVVIAIVEGLTEFLPVSSTGHMILAGELIGFKGPGSASLEIIIQLGAILAVCVVYRQRLLDVGRGLVLRQPEALIFTRNVLLGFMPALMVGAVAYEFIKSALSYPILIAWALILGGVAMLWIERRPIDNKINRVETMPAKTALGIGIIQCLSMIPGVSRSGATIMGGLLLRVERKTAAEYSFFLAVPTMAAATAKDVWENYHMFTSSQLIDISIGFCISFLVALLVVRSFVGFVGRYGFVPFAWYRIVIGTLALAFLYSRSL